jgi:hypothetical protein
MLIPIPEASLANVHARATYSEPATVVPAVAAPMPVSQRLRKRKHPLMFFRIVLSLLVPMASSVAGYFILKRAGVLQRPQPVATRAEVTRLPPSQPVMQRQSLAARNTISAAPQDVAHAPAPPPAPAAPAVELPKSFDLPSPSDFAAQRLTAAKNFDSVAFTSVSPQLTLVEQTLQWQEEGHASQAVASLALQEGQLVFQWMAGAPDEAVAATYNSVVRLGSSTTTSAGIPLRTPLHVEVAQIDLEKRVQRILGKCDYLPPLNSIRFTFSPDPTFPSHVVSGNGLSNLERNDETLLRYHLVDTVATRVQIKRHGSVLAADVQTRYLLPSGEAGDFTLSQGKQKQKELEKLRASVRRANRALEVLRKNRSAAESSLNRWKSAPTAHRVQGTTLINDAVLVGQKAEGIRTASNALTEINRVIASAERAASQQGAIDAEFALLARMSELAQQITASPGWYFKFYAVVDETEILLIEAVSDTSATR